MTRPDPSTLPPQTQTISGQTVSSVRLAPRLMTGPVTTTTPNIDPILMALRQAQQASQGGQWTQAIKACEGVIAQCRQRLQSESNQTPNEVSAALGQAYLEQGQQFKQDGQVEAAVRAYLRALQHQPRLFTAYSRLRYNLMRYALKPGATVFSEVIAVCQHIIAQNPDLVPAHITMGYALTKQGNLAAATACYKAISAQVARQRQPIPTNWKAAQRRAPDFLVIGAEKCGTTSLHHYLSQHPEILSPVEKEIDFFDLEYDHGIDWYLAHFPPLPPQTGWLTGETSANYLYSKVAPQRVFEHFPKTKLFVILRHPIDRMVSRYNMMVSNGAEKRSLETVVSQEMERIQKAMTADDIPWPILNRCRHLGNSLYYYHLKRWLEIFPREQLLVLQSESLFSQPEPTMQQIFETLGLRHYSHATYPQQNAGDYQPINDDLYQTLADFFAPHIQKLEAYLGQTFDWSSSRKSGKDTATCQTASSP